MIDLKLDVKQLELDLNTKALLEDDAIRNYVSLYQRALEISFDDNLSEDDKKLLAYKDVLAEALINCHSGLIYTTAKKLCNGKNYILEDLLQEGRMGLLHATRKFDSGYKNKFITYAYNWIYDYMSKYYHNNCQYLRLPKKSQLQLFKATKIKNELIQKLGYEPSLAEIAKEANIAEDELMVLFRSNQYVSRLDSKFEDSDNLKYVNLIKDPDNPFKKYNKEVLLSTLMSSFQKLDFIEAEVIKNRFGLNDSKVLTLRELGERFGFTKERIRQIESKALIKLSLDDKLKEYQKYVG